jgi:hypothetical protein
MSDSFKYLDKIHQHPFLWKYSKNHINYPNPEYLNTYIPSTTSTNVYLIMFTIETNTVYPFVKFAMTSKTGSIKSAGPPTFSASGNEDEFVIECNKVVLSSFENPNASISEFFDIAFTGFMNIGTSTFVFYNIEPLLEQGYRLNNVFRFLLSCEVCESTNKGLQLLNAQTEYPKCVLFQPVYQYQSTASILLEEIPLPVVAYSVSQVPTLTYLDEADGLYYVFTEKYVGDKNTLHSRFALFLMNSKPLSNKGDGVNTFTFMKNGVLHFAVKSPDQFIAL